MLPLQAALEDVWVTNWNTGYTEEEGFGEWSRTANGTVPGLGTVAVDPNVYPYGTVFFWPEYAEKYDRYGVALDCGGAVIGEHLDWWYYTNREANLMTKTASARVLRYGWNDWIIDPKDWGL
jgi:3D (Asp-Asp-Asp) domain-containing protein